VSITQEELEAFVAAFADGDYRRAAEAGRWYARQGAPLGVLVLAAIAEGRSAGPHARAALCEELAPAVLSDRWAAALIGYLGGRTPWEKLKAFADYAEDRVQALFVRGALALDAGRLDDAATCLRACLDCGVESLEAYLAAFDLVRCEAAAEAGPLVAALDAVPADEVVAALDEHVRRHEQGGATERVAPLVDHLLDRCRPGTGREHARVALLRYAGGALRRAGDPYRAVAYLRDYLGLVEPALLQGEEEPVSALLELALAYRDADDTSTAEHALADALSLLGAGGKADSPLGARILLAQAELARRGGDLARVSGLFVEVVRIHAARRDASPADYFAAVSDLGLALELQGRYEEAERAYRSALAHGDELVRAGAPAFTCLNNLAVLLKETGQLREVDELLTAALEICDRQGAGTTAQTASILTNLAGLYVTLGQFAEAEDLYSRALDAFRASGDAAAPEAAACLHNLGRLLSAAGEPARALGHYEEALRIRERYLGRRHPESALTLNNTGLVLRQLGRYDEAYAALSEAAATFDERYGLSHPDAATALNNLGRVVAEMGHDEAGLDLLRRALEARRSLLGPEHPDMAASHFNIAVAEARRGRLAEARDAFAAGQAVVDALVDQVFSLASERQRASFVETVEEAYHTTLSFLTRYGQSNPALLRTAFEYVQRRKGIGAEVLSVQRIALLRGAYPHLEGDFEELVRVRRRLARLLIEGPAGEAEAEFAGRVGALRERRDAIEKRLAREVSEIRAATRLTSAGADEVLARLPADAAAVEFVRFRAFDFEAAPARGESEWHGAVYGALVLNPRNPDPVRYVELGDADRLDALVNRFRDEMQSDPLSRSLRGLGAAAAVAPRPPQSSRDNLTRGVFDPLATAIAGVRTLVLAPDGNLNRLPFGALSLGDGEYLIDRFLLCFLVSTREVVRFADRERQPAEAPVVIADPDFDLADEPTGEPAPRAAGADARVAAGGTFDFGRGFEALPGTRLEAARVAGMIGARSYLGADAVDDVLKNSRGPRVLHVATHGFYFDEAGGSARGPDAELMLSSGLALAGANTVLRGGPVPRAARDALLTAEAICGLALDETELVVLSACESGLGSVKTGEGVFGLRRAFAVAGARRLVISLLKVPDVATAVLMDRFYAGLVEGRPPAEALREAQRYVRTVTVGRLRADWLTEAAISTLAGSNEALESALESLAGVADDVAPFGAPVFWGAFVFQGDPEPFRIVEQGPA
jgi:CHAT domain-containing protein/tetratricopeptide (TPR) repeat protein